MSVRAAAPALALAAFLATRLMAWPPHEDEMLALTVGRGSFGQLVDTVVHQRGGAPLHFVLAWVAEHAGGGLVGLRLLSATFAVASIPVVWELVRRLADERAATAAAVLAVASWTVLFHAVYARMYSLFLFASALSYLALLNALRDGGARRWTLWGLAVLLCVATHPYGALVLASQALYVLATRARVREAVVAFPVVAVAGIPFWIIDLVLAGRFDVGVGPGGGGTRLGRPDRIADYLGRTAADFTAGPVVLPIVLVLAGIGGWWLWRVRRPAALLVLAVVLTPTIALLVARLGATAAPETRHLVFTFPFFLGLVAAGIVRRPPATAAAITALLVVGGVFWAWDKTPSLFRGEPAQRVEGRAAAADWLAKTGRPDDVLLGYEPVFIDAQRRDPSFSRLILPRADARLQLRGLKGAKSLGRGVWVFSSWGPTSVEQRLHAPLLLPRPGGAFEARTFGPYLVIRSRRPVESPARYLELAAAAMITGKTIGIADADVNFATISSAATLLDEGYEASASRSSSTSSR